MNIGEQIRAKETQLRILKSGGQIADYRIEIDRSDPNDLKMIVEIASVQAADDIKVDFIVVPEDWGDDKLVDPFGRTKYEIGIDLAKDTDQTVLQAVERMQDTQAMFGLSKEGIARIIGEPQQSINMQKYVMSPSQDELDMFRKPKKDPNFGVIGERELDL